MVLLAVRKVEGDDGKAVLRLTLSRDGEGGTASFICASVGESGVRGLVESAEDNLVSFLLQDLNRKD